METKEKETKITMDKKDIEKNKGMAALAYLIFFIPLLAVPDSKFAKFHANQGLNLLLLALAINILGSMLSATLILAIIGIPLLFIGGIFTLVLFIMGVINAFNGEAKQLPLIGKIEIIK
jgi:uncharacterized membrane protein